MPAALPTSHRKVSRWSSPAPLTTVSPVSSLRRTTTMASALAQRRSASASLGASAGDGAATATRTTGATVRETLRSGMRSDALDSTSEPALTSTLSSPSTPTTLPAGADSRGLWWRPAMATRPWTRTGRGLWPSTSWAWRVAPGRRVPLRTRARPMTRWPEDAGTILETKAKVGALGSAAVRTSAVARHCGNVTDVDGASSSLACSGRGGRRASALSRCAWCGEGRWSTTARTTASAT
mmetsp:Transcript_54828/g.119379  ORF Transcript_54828/g.119379 Transcript_54828/m.119379 type:complete len:238 (+) Transcript_54828:367-1080(+)